MRLSKRQLKRIIREEYSRLKRRGLIKESIAVGPVEIYNASPDDGWNTYASFDEAFQRCVDPSVNEYVMCYKERGFEVQGEGMPYYYMSPYAEEISGECVFVGCSTKEECEDRFKGDALEI